MKIQREADLPDYGIGSGEPDQDWKEQFREQFCLRKPNGIDITNIVIDYTDRYVIRPLQARIKELEARITQLEAVCEIDKDTIQSLQSGMRGEWDEE